MSNADCYLLQMASGTSFKDDELSPASLSCKDKIRLHLWLNMYVEGVLQLSVSTDECYQYMFP